MSNPEVFGIFYDNTGKQLRFVALDEYEKLQAENERLLKAGDAMARIIANDLNCEGPYTASAMQSIYLAWQAAKGVQS